MVFTTGNIITLLIVVLILFLYRQLDKGNRSLEKVKRYSDKIRDDLEKFVDERTTEIKDIAVELEVHQKSGREVLNRIQSIEDEIASRADVLDKVNDRILGYDGSLSELEELTKAVQENVNRIRKESEFVDTIGKRLKDSSQRIALIEKQIPEINQYFTEENQNRFNELKDIILGESRESYQALELLVKGESDRIQELADYVNQLEDRKELFEKRLTENAQNLMNESLKTAEDKGSQIKNELIQTWEQAVSSYRTQFNQAQDEASKNYTALIKDYQQKIDNAREKGINLESEVFEQLKANISSHVNSLNDNWAHEIEQINNQLQQQIQELDQTSQDDLGNIQRSVTDRIESQQQVLDDRIQEIDDSYRSRMTTLQDQLDQNLSDMNDQLSRFDRDLQQTLSEQDDRLQDFSPKIDQLAQDFDSRFNNLTNEVVERQNNISNDLKVSQDSLSQDLENRLAILSQDQQSLLANSISDMEQRNAARIKEAESQLLSQGEELSKDIIAQEQSLSKVIEDLESDIQRRYTDALQKLDLNQQDFTESTEAAKSKIDNFQQQYQSLADNLNQKIIHHKESQDRAFEDMNQELKDQIQNLEDQMIRVQTLSDEIESLAGETRALAHKQKEEFYQELEDSQTTLIATLKDSHKGVENTVFQSLDNRLTSYEEGISGRLDKLEALSNDIENLDENLRQLMKTFMVKAEDNLHKFEERLEDDKNNAAVRLNQDILSLDDEMKRLETELNGLKERAYDNVSSKLKIFEDDFFEDLKTRSGQMEAALDEWSANFNNNLSETKETQRIQQEDLSNRLSQMLRNELNELEKNSMNQITNLEDQLKNFQNELTTQLAKGSDDIQSQEQELNKQLKQMELASQERFDQEIRNQESLFGDKLVRYENELQGRLNLTTDAIETSRLENQQLLEAARDDVTRWQSKILQDIKTTEGDFSLKLDDWRRGLESQMGQIKDEFLAQREDIILSSQEERIKLKKELQEMSDQMSDLQGDLKERTIKAIEGLEREKEVFILDFQKKTREIVSESDDKQREIFQSLQDARNTIETHQQNFTDKIDQSYQLITTNLEALERRQQEFVAQTKIFDRADSLKLELESKIGDLKSDITRVEKDREELVTLSQEILKIRDLTNDVSDKLSDFYDQRNKIEAMENDFQKVVSISNSIDTKLVSVTESHDRLQDIQVKLRRLEENEKGIAQIYQRLEQKQDLLSETIDGVDKSFDQLKSIEERIFTIRTQLDNLPEQVDSIRELLDQVQTDKSQVDHAIQQLTNLDESVEYLETRINEMNKAREWLAKTETRLEEISKQAQEQVRLLGTLAKDEPASRRTKGAPNMDIRESVIKLARQNWKIEEIARATKLSRGEVELILEMGVKG
ncbi:SpiroCoCo family coiled-coil protein [Spirochaeta cellobiosiphila]|uniref:SpiroCoCo family coiled-coil protein n=1 Tax=Spirochaeta cellobiosiphila TaxID=504483 RepID=UPI00040F1BE2|nr:hypothetical protein [Spirochaeta cellobiosiphila]